MTPANRVPIGCLVAATLLVVLACADTSANGAPAVATSAKPGPGRAGNGGASAGAGANSGGRQSPMIVLAATDVFTVVLGEIETTTPLSGDLRPIEEIAIRARIEGDLTAVNAREGEPIRTGQVLARFDPAELDAAFTAAQADLAAARGESASADWNLEQSRELFKVGAISEQAFKVSEQGALASRARLAASESKLRSAELARRDAQVVAPAAGTISQRLVQTGERVSRGAQLFVLVRDDTLEFTAAIPARAASLVRAGQEVRFAVDGRDFVGHVARVSPAIDLASRSVAVYVRVPNRSHDLKANAFASGRLVSNIQAGVLTVPLTAIRRSRQDDAPFVYRLEGDQISTAQVHLGGSDEARGLVEITDGLAVDDRVVVGNVGTIGRGMRVQVLGADGSSGRGSGEGRGGRSGKGGRGGRGRGTP